MFFSCFYWPFELVLRTIHLLICWLYYFSFWCLLFWTLCVLIISPLLDELLVEILLPFRRSSLLFGDYFLCCAELSVRLVPKGIVILDLEFEIIAPRPLLVGNYNQHVLPVFLKKVYISMLWESNSWEAFWHIAGLGIVSLRKVVERLEKWLSVGKRSGDYGGWGKCL